MPEPVPQIVPVSRLARDQRAVLKMLRDGPVILTQNGKAVAVMVSVETWNETVRRLAELEHQTPDGD